MYLSLFGNNFTKTQTINWIFALVLKYIHPSSAVPCVKTPMISPLEEDCRPWYPERSCCDAARGQTSSRMPTAHLCTASFSHKPSKNTRYSHLQQASLKGSLLIPVTNKQMYNTPINILKSSHLFSKLREECKTSTFHWLSLGGRWTLQANSLLKRTYFFIICTIPIISGLHSAHVQNALY